MIPTQALGAIRETYDRCRQRYATVDLSLEVFLKRIEEVVALTLDSHDPKSPDHWAAAFATLHHEDLFLALACSHGDRIAWEHFADDYLPQVQRFAAQSCRGRPESEDLAQEIVTTLLASMESGKDSKLAGYNGKGSLAGWLRVAVAHAAIDHFRRFRKEILVDNWETQGNEVQAAPDAAGPLRDAEPLDSRWGPVLSRLLAEELKGLAARDRLLLSLYYLHGVSLKAIGRQFDVHEATASRWLESLRQGIRKRIERELRLRHGFRGRDLDSLWRWVSDNESFSLERILTEKSGSG
jgi:RNA polymerase sigma-70 factor